MITKDVRINTNRRFYSELRKKKGYNISTRNCIEETVRKLLNNRTTNENPGMLLGKIQSGKTRTFIGVTALGFDNGYDVTVVLTKGTKALAQQTYQRLKKDFSDLIEEDQVQIFDIMNLPDNLTRYELDQKLIFIVKKEKNNLTRLYRALFETYPELAKKKILIIDDEADFASVGFRKTDKEIYEMNTIAKLIDDLRQNLQESDFLQVTATPYSLYLQPNESITLSGFTFKPVKPAFTVLVPVGSGYIGGDYYFKESEDDDTVAFYLHEEIKEDELEILKKPDRRRFKIEDALTSNRITSLRDAMIKFIVGGVIRRLQHKNARQKQKKYSFIIHTEQSKAAHQWQEEIVIELKAQLFNAMNEEPIYFQGLMKKSYDQFVPSLSKLKCYIPQFDDVNYFVREALKNDHIMITKVNSEQDVNQLLDESGQLKLRVPLNIFIGGQILDRGITIGNLIGFYYGRNPNQFQQDTVLQHSRMFGYRPIEDLALTRFYTTANIYDVMRRIHEVDTSLRIAIENTSNDSVVFIQKDLANQIVPCSPNKILLSKVTALKPHKRLLPIGFQTGPKTRIQKTVTLIDEKVNRIIGNEEKEPKLISLDDAIDIIKSINETYDKYKGLKWDVDAFLASIEHLSKNIPEKDKGKVWLIVRNDRNISRIREKSGKFEDAPDTPKGKDSELRIAKQIGIEHPVLILLRQNGLVEKGWRGTPFWWPVLVTPEQTPPVLFASETIDK